MKWGNRSRRSTELRTAWTITAVSVDHYENFPVASFLCPPALRPAIAAIYWFARTADDLADEGSAAPEQRLAALDTYRTDLLAIATNNGLASQRWEKVFGPLRATIARHHLPLNLLTDLLSAFEQDVVKQRYVDRTELLEYCRRSANPVGRLLLHLYGIRDVQALAQSDAICTSLQLINFCQDLGVDTHRGRLYIPATDCARHGVDAFDLLAGRDSTAVRALLAEQVAWARSLMLAGAPLVHAIQGRAGWELRLVVQGGLRILDRIEAGDFATLHTRSVLRWHDAPVMLWRAIRMQPLHAPGLGQPHDA